MTTQPEQVLETNLVKQLNELGHESVIIKNETDLLANLKSQLEKHNEINLSDKEFNKILNHLNKGNVFEKAGILRDKMQFEKDNGETAYIEFINQDHWCKNQFQVTRQVTMTGSYQNRYKEEGLNSKKLLIKLTVIKGIRSVHLTVYFNTYKFLLSATVLILSIMLTTATKTSNKPFTGQISIIITLLN